MADDRSFEELAKLAPVGPHGRASARLKSKVYSALVNAMAAEGPLLSLGQNRIVGDRLCLFEHAVALTPIGEEMKCRNPCRVCHARVLGERLDHAPIFWPGCPYSDFHNG